MYGSGVISTRPADKPCGQVSAAGASQQLMQLQQLQQLAMQQEMMGGALARSGSPYLSPSVGPSMQPFSLGPGGNCPPSPRATSPRSHGFNRRDCMRGHSSGRRSPVSPSRMPLPVSSHSFGSPSGRSAQMAGSALQRINGQQVLVIRLAQYVPQQAHPQETQEQQQFRHALPARMLHKHQRWIEQQLGPRVELVLNRPPSVTGACGKAPPAGDVQYEGPSEVCVVGEFHPGHVQRVFDDLFIHNKRTVQSSRARCCEVISSSQALTETTGAFAICRPADERIDIYGPQAAVAAAQAYLTSPPQPQSGVAELAIRVKSAAASVVLRQRVSILSPDEGSIWVKPPPLGRPVEEQTVYINVYSDARLLDRAEQAIRDIERMVMQCEGAGSSPAPSPQSVNHLDPTPVQNASPPMDGQMPELEQLQLAEMLGWQGAAASAAPELQQLVARLGVAPAATELVQRQLGTLLGPSTDLDLERWQRAARLGAAAPVLAPAAPWPAAPPTTVPAPAAPRPSAPQPTALRHAAPPQAALPTPPQPLPPPLPVPQPVQPPPGERPGSGAGAAPEPPAPSRHHPPPAASAPPPLGPSREQSAAAPRLRTCDDLEQQLTAAAPRTCQQLERELGLTIGGQQLGEAEGARQAAEVAAVGAQAVRALQQRLAAEQERRAAAEQAAAAVRQRLAEAEAAAARLSAELDESREREFHAAAAAAAGRAELAALEESDRRAEALGAGEQMPPVQLTPTARRNERTGEWEETDAQRLHQRRRQVGLGKATCGYRNYEAAVPRSQRQPGNCNHPQTPRYRQVCSKRSFETQMSTWRNALHAWDDNPSPESMRIGGSSTAWSSGPSPQTSFGHSTLSWSARAEPHHLGTHAVPAPALPAGQRIMLKAQGARCWKAVTLPHSATWVEFSQIAAAQLGPLHQMWREDAEGDPLDAADDSSLEGEASAARRAGAEGSLRELELERARLRQEVSAAAARLLMYSDLELAAAAAAAGPAAAAAACPAAAAAAGPAAGLQETQQEVGDAEGARRVLEQAPHEPPRDEAPRRHVPRPPPWTCRYCGFANQAKAALLCGRCLARRPDPPSRPPEHCETAEQVLSGEAARIVSTAPPPSAAEEPAADRPDISAAEAPRQPGVFDPAAADQAAREACVVCHESRGETVFFPCAHLGHCSHCVERLERDSGAGQISCPLCRARVRAARPRVAVHAAVAAAAGALSSLSAAAARRS